MAKTTAQNFFRAAGAAFGIVAFFSFLFLARAVTPGVVGNPTFGPQDDDVRMTGYLSGPVQIVETTGTGVAACPAGYKVTGGSCHSSGVVTYWIINGPQAGFTGWSCNAGVTGTLITQAICLKSL